MTKDSNEKKNYVTDLDYLVIHKLNKEKNQKPSIEFRESLNPVNKTSLTLVNRLYESYRHKTRKTYGTFSSKSGSDNYSSELFKYFGSFIGYTANPEMFPDALELAQKEFLEFTKKAMEIYKARIASENLATGGYTLFAQFNTQSTKYFGVLVLSEHQQFLIEGNMELADTDTINIGDIRLGCLINMEKWQRTFDYSCESYPAPENPQDAPGPYLSFTSKSNQRASEYFISFIGATNLSDRKKNTDDLKNLINTFLEETGVNEAEQRERKSNLYNKISPNLARGNPVELSTISAFISDPENNSEFIDFLNNRPEDHQLSSDLELDNNSMRGLRNVYIKRKDGLKLSFSRELLDEGRVVIDKENSIIISGFNDAEINEIRK